MRHAAGLIQAELAAPLSVIRQTANAIAGEVPTRCLEAAFPIAGVLQQPLEDVDDHPG